MIKRRYALNAVRIFIDRFDGEFCGRVYSMRSRNCLTFKNAAQMMLRIDAFLDSNKYPQAFQIRRTFSDRKVQSGRYVLTEEDLEEALKQEEKNACSADVIITSRRRTTWQGYIKTEGKETVKYKSEMELLKELCTLKADKEI